MLGDDTFLLQTALEVFLVRVNRFAAPPNAEEAALAERALSELRFGLGMRDPSLVATAQQVVNVLDGESAFGNFGPRQLGPSLIDAGFERQLLRRFEQEFELGRLVVERELIVTLSEPKKQPGAEPAARPPARPDSKTHSFEVRFVDEVGKAITGVDAAFSADDAQTRPTNAAGIALLEEVKGVSANVALLDPDALAKALDPRWEKFRPGAPPKESNTTEVVFRGVALGPFELKAEVPNTVVIKPPLGKLFVELWDKTGRVRHANRSYRIKGPRSFEGTTDADGRLLHEDVIRGDYQLSVTIEIFEDDPDRISKVVDCPLIVLEPEAAAPQVRLLAAVPRSTLARLHMFFDTNKTFLLPSALRGLRELRSLYEEKAPCDLLVVGHADTAGGASFNDQLSLERAESTIAYLKDDVDGWLKFYSDGNPKKCWGSTEDHSMLSALPDIASKPASENEVRFFQRTRQLQVDGVAGKETRRALIEEYMALDGTSLTQFVGEIEATAHGGGENFPLDESGEALDATAQDGKADATDRRVELFFFDPEFGISPKPPGPNSGPSSSEYPLWRARAAETVDISASGVRRTRAKDPAQRSELVAGPPASFSALVVDDADQAIPGIDVLLTFGSVSKRATTDDTGLASFDRVPARSATARIAKVSQVRDVLRPRFSQPRTLAVFPAGSVVTRSLAAVIEPVELQPNVPQKIALAASVQCHEIPGANFDFGRSFVRSSAIAQLAEIAEAIRNTSDVRAMIFGHTDLSGSEALNKELSERRARAVHALLSHDSAAWEQLFSGTADGPNWQEKWDLEETQNMLNALGVTDDTGAPLSENGKRDAPTKQAIRRFQRGDFPDRPAEQAPLPESDALGVDGRRALFLAYAKRITRAPIEPDRFAPIGGASSMGCGEFNSLSLSTKDTASRRVNVFLFDPVAEPQQLPCKLRQLGPCRANLDPVPTQLGANGRAPFRCRVFQGLASKCTSQPSPDLSHDVVLRFPLQLARANKLRHKYTLEADDGTITLERTLAEDGRANDDTLVELAFEHLPETHRYRLTCDDGESPPYTVFDFSTLQELQNTFQAILVAVDLQIPSGVMALATQPAAAVAPDTASSNSSADDDQGETA